MQIDNIEKSFTGAGIDMSSVGGNLFTEIMKIMDKDLATNLPSLQKHFKQMELYRLKTDKSLDDHN